MNSSSATGPRVSILMPTFDHARFIRRAIDSLLAQTLSEWELIVVDDGSTDETPIIVKPFLVDKRIHYHRLDSNQGLGRALNYALEHARAPLIAYLPSDDVYHAEHLASLVEELSNNTDAVLAYSGVRHHYNRFADGQIDGYPLQLVQVIHRRTPDRWVERTEVVTDDLGRMLWDKLRNRGAFVSTERVTCEWVDHPGQRHKIVQEPVGGINPYRRRYGVKHPLRFHTTVGNYIDEVGRYRHYRERPDTPMAEDGLKIVLVGELAYNADRVLALEERGHKLYGLWMEDPYWYNSVGPLPFGHVEDLPRSDWQAALRQIQPDIIYALLNWQAVPFAHQVMMNNPGIPFVWHFKEGPFICLEKGSWNQLVNLYARADGQIYSSPEMRDWFDTIVPGLTKQAPTLVLDGDLPKRDWFSAERSPRLSDSDGELHTVVPGRPIGLHPHTVAELAEQGVHLHFYGDFTHGQWHKWIEKARHLAPDHLHLHAHVDQEDWVSEFSQYDAGWLHFFHSRNKGDLRRADWDDLNYPARMATLAIAGLPLLQADNSEAVVAVHSIARRFDLGLFFDNMEELAEQLRDRERLDRLRESVWQQREIFTFDYHADRLIDFFRKVIATYQEGAR
ncbi:MAG: glycosyltransferase family 2 protein [Chloroflexota bacterium]|nr:glycosyltransferase family 2 protein [Chloroflexota bacterium]